MHCIPSVLPPRSIYTDNSSRWKQLSSSCFGSHHLQKTHGEKGGGRIAALADHANNHGALNIRVRILGQPLVCASLRNLMSRSMIGEPFTFHVAHETTTSFGVYFPTIDSMRAAVSYHQAGAFLKEICAIVRAVSSWGF